MLSRVVGLVWLIYTLCSSPLHGSPVSQVKEDSAKNTDQVVSLPFLPATSKVVQYSGYLRGQTDNIQLHYWLIEAEESPETAPLFVWLNGGPGCSSLYGLLSIHGPFLVTTGSKLKENPYSWNKIANIIYLETPAGVGFSYAADGNITTDDDQMAVNNYYALLDFSRKFPQYKGRDFYITGESYAGIYIPMLALQVMQNPFPFSLKGLAIGNGAVNMDLTTKARYYFMFTHNLIDLEMWRNLTTECCHGLLKNFCPKVDYLNKQCIKILNEADENVFGKLFPYDIYAPCEGGIESYYDGRNIPQLPLKHLPFEVRQPCQSSKDITGFLQNPDVRKAIHVDLSIKWEQCNDDLFRRKYIRRRLDMKSQIQTILRNGVPILLFSGDTDLIVAPAVSEWFINSLNTTNLLPYRPWLYEEVDSTLQVGGYRKVLSVGKTRLTRATVRGAGHAVAIRKPVSALHMISIFIENGYIP